MLLYRLDEHLDAGQLDPPEALGELQVDVGRETAGTTPFLFSVSLAEPNIRQWYDLLTSPKTREKLDAQKEKSRFFAALSELYDEKKLPPFEVIAPYLGTGGGILYDTDNGYHAISFSLKNEATKASKTNEGRVCCRRVPPHSPDLNRSIGYR